MRTKRSIFLVLTFLFASTVFAQQAIEFIENKGQWDARVQFMGQVPGGAFFIHKSGFTVLQHDPEEWAQLKESIHGVDKNNSLAVAPPVLNSHAYRVDFIGAAANPEIVADKALPTYTNYFIGNDPAKWATNCKVYQGITVKNIYPNVDLRYYSNSGTMKYDLLVKPGADLSRVALRYNGVDGLDIEGKELRVRTTVGTIRELDPYSYQYNHKGKKDVGARYKVEGNVVRFDIKDYDRAATLVIDPTLIFASFSGSTADNWGFTATYGPDGSMYGGGIVFGQGFPTSVGAFQQNYTSGGSFCGQKGVDIGIIKLTPDGTSRVYATYIGGNGNEQPHSLIVDAAGNLILAGRTDSDRSAAGYPTTGVGMIGPGGGFDIVVTKLNATGTAIIGSKRIGGSADDGVNITPCSNGRTSLQYNYGDAGRSEVILDGGNVLVASCTQSKDFEIVGGFQGSFGGGTQDGVVLKLDGNINGLMFSSYLGGDKNDAAYVLSVHAPTGNIYVAGGTESTDFRGTNPGVKYSANQGGVDGFVSIISNSGASIVSSTYMGTSGTDQIFGIQFDRFNFPYITGQSTGAFPVTSNVVFSQPGGKQFIAKLKVDLSDFVYSTVFGTGSAIPNISPTAFLVDRCENVYVSGWGGDVSSYSSGGTMGLSTVGAMNPKTDGKDFYFFVLKKDATAQLYGDFYGQAGGAFPDHVDGGTSRFDANGVIYQAICADCGREAGLPPYPTTPGAWSTVKPPPITNCNLAMLKIEINLAGTRAAIQPSINGVPRDSAGCVPLTVDFRDTVLSAVSYEWDLDGDGVTDFFSNTPDATYTYNSVGSYKVRLIAVDSTSCNIRDTAYVTIRVGDLQAPPAFTYTKLNPCEALSYQFNNTSVAPPVRPFGANSFVWDFGDGTPRVVAGTQSITHSYTAPGPYKVRLILTDTGYCNAIDSVEQLINVAALVKARIKPIPNACTPYTVNLQDSSDGGQTYFWDFGDGNNSTQKNPTHKFINNGSAPLPFTISLRVTDSATCNVVDSAKITITVYPKPLAGFSIGSPQPPPLNTPIRFVNTSSPDAVRFKWLFGDGDSLMTTSREPVEHEYNTTKTYNACLIAYNSTDCADTLCLDVQSVSVPALDVPNAFTPLSGDQNSVIFARGFAIGKIRFTIWNRWGQKVFETNDRKRGWDGRYNGQVQPMDVYAYTLDVEFTDGTKARKSGDITLIR